MKILVIDNYDSFVYNLAQYVGLLGCEPLVYRNDEISLRRALALHADRIIISPGPGNPQDPHYFGVCTAIIRKLGRKTPVLGVCLGHQGIAYTFGGSIIPARRLMHGKTSVIKHNRSKLFRGVQNPFTAARYHSLAVDRASFPACLEETATSLDDDEIMALKHKEYPIYGVQFHPESILTKVGLNILSNFLEAP